MKTNTTLNFADIFLSAIISLFFLFTGSAQELKIYEIFENNPQESSVVLSKAGKLAKTSTVAVSTTYTDDLNYFNELNYNLNPSIYVANNAIVIMPENNQTPIKLNLEDTKSFDILKSGNPIFETIELIEINVESASELNATLDVSTLQGFSNLKYIFVQCNQFNTSVSQMQRFLTNVGSDITVYFMTINPS